MADTMQNKMTVEGMLEYLWYLPDSEAKLNEAREALEAYPLSEGQLKNIKMLLNNLSVNYETITKIGRNSDEKSTFSKAFKYLLKEGEFESIVKGISDYNTTDSQFNTLRKCSMFSDILFNSVVEKMEPTEKFHHCTKETVSFSASAFLQSLELLSKYQISDHAVDLLNDEWERVGGVDIKTLEKYMSNLVQYDQLTKPWGVWFKEMLGIAADESELANTIEVKQHELHADPQITDSAEHLV